jgi:SAM-dependent methyltransferase
MTESSVTSRNPILGVARRADGAMRTVAVFLAGVNRIAPDLKGSRFLDVGCGDGTFTCQIAKDFVEVHGVDVQSEYAADFAAKGCGSFHAVSSSSMPFPDRYFDAVLALETLEHVDDLRGTAREISRVIKLGATLILSVPNRWYPIEGHGGIILGWDFSRLPLVTWVPPLHRRIAKARVFTVRDLDRLFGPLGFRRTKLGYLWPTFEHGANTSYLRIQKAFRWLYPLMRAMERGPLRFFGSSILAKYERVSSEPNHEN